VRPLILASTSTYRRDLLDRLGLPFTSVAPAVDETPEPGELPALLAARLARRKALAPAVDDAVIIGADQVATLDGAAIGKPGNRPAALSQLEACQGRSMLFHTAVAVVDKRSGRVLEHMDLTRVHFARRSREELERYVDLEPAFDCAGGFKAEALGIVLFQSIESRDPTALIGLPLVWLAGTLRELGFDPLAAAR
jgi:septum formation protein